MKQISERVYQIGLGSVNCFLIDDNGLTLVDTGTKGNASRIFDAIKKGGKDPQDIRRIILTHAHPDHSGSATAIQKHCGASVIAHADDAARVKKGITIGENMNLTPGVANWLIYNLFIKRSDPRIDPVVVTQTVSDREILPIAGGTHVIHTPGHSPGHIALLVKEEGVLIGADICANMGRLAISTMNEDLNMAVQSIGKVAELYFDKAVFGHGSALKKGADKKMKRFFERIETK